MGVLPACTSKGGTWGVLWVISKGMQCPTAISRPPGAPKRPVPRQSGVTEDPPGIVSRPTLALLTCLSLVAPATPALAQVESFLLQPGSSVGPATKVTPTNCVTGPDGSVTCDTKLENSPSDTPARPEYQPFKN